MSIAKLAMIVALAPLFGSAVQAQPIEAPPGFPTEAPAAPPLAPSELPTPFSQKLDNGMEVVVVTSDEIPWVSVSWYLLAGAKFDEAGKAGTASETASMLHQGTEDHDDETLAEMLDSHAINLNGSAGHETSVVSAGCLVDHIELAVNTMAEVIRRPIFPEREFRRQISQDLNGLHMAESDGKYWAGREFDKRIYGRHYRANPTEGTTDSLPNITRDDLAAFHKQHYLPNNSILVFSGDIKPEQAMELASKFFGDWSKCEVAVLDVPPPPKLRETRIYLVDRPGSTQSHIRVGQAGYKRTDADYFVGEVFNQVFGGGFNSRLNSTVRIEEGLSYGAGGSFHAGKELGHMMASTFTKNETTADTVKAVLDVIQSMQTDPPTKEELSDSKSYLTGKFALSLETPRQVASKVFNLKFYGLPNNYYETYFKKINSYSSAEVSKFARKRIDAAHLAIIVVGDAAQVKASLEEIAPVTVVKPDHAIPVE